MLTALNIRQFQHLSWPAAISRGLVEKAKKFADASVTARLEATLEGKEKAGNEVGLLLAERFANMPLALIPPLHRALIDDIEWSCTTPECPEEERPFYRFSNFVG